MFEPSPAAPIRFARASSAMTKAGSVSSIACFNSSGCHQPLIRVAIPPAFTAAM